MFLQAIAILNTDGKLAFEGFQYMLVKKDRYEDVLDFFRDHFLPDEPLGRSLGYTSGVELRGMHRLALEDNLSIALVSRQTNKIIGGRIIRIAVRNEVPDLSGFMSESFKKGLAIVSELDRRCNVFDHYQVEEVIHFLGFCVHRDFRRQGIGEKLMRAGICFVSNLNLGNVVIKSEGTSKYSQRVFEKVGFDMLAEVVYADCKVDGKVVTTGIGDHTCEKLYGMRIKIVR